MLYLLCRISVYLYILLHILLRHSVMVLLRWGQGPYWESSEHDTDNEGYNDAAQVTVMGSHRQLSTTVHAPGAGSLLGSMPSRLHAGVPRGAAVPCSVNQ